MGLFIFPFFLTFSFIDTFSSLTYSCYYSDWYVGLCIGNPRSWNIYVSSVYINKQSNGVSSMGGGVIMSLTCRSCDMLRGSSTWGSLNEFMSHSFLLELALVGPESCFHNYVVGWFMTDGLKFSKRSYCWMCNFVKSRPVFSTSKKIWFLHALAKVQD